MLNSTVVQGAGCRVHGAPCPGQNWNRAVNCTILMLFAWLLIWPNDEFPNDELAGAAHCTMLNMLSTSTRSDAEVPPPVRTCLLTPRSTLFRQGDSTPSSIRGALPNWFAAAFANAALL